MAFRHEAIYWIREAWNDICTAQILFNAHRWNASAFHSHQAVEKALKALYLAVLRIDPPKIHVLPELYRELKRAGINFSPELEDKIAELNKFYTVSRYPDAAAGQPFEVVTKDDASKSLNTAREVVSLIEDILRGVGYEGTPGSIRDCT